MAEGTGAAETLAEKREQARWRASFAKAFPFAIAFLTILAGWQVAAWIFPSFLIPSPSQVFVRLSKEFGREVFLTTVARSFARLAVGFSLACFLGLTVGLLSGVWSFFRLYSRALVSILQSVPPIAWVPLFIILLGFGDYPIVLVILIAAFFPMAVSVMNAVEQVDRLRVDVARLMGANRAQLVTKVYAPEVVPAIITGAQVGFGNAWRSLIAAEMVGGVNVGLGWFITFSGEVADMVGVLAGIFVIGFFAAVLDGYVLERLKRRLLKWKYL
ncbi:MAG: ABC transporter permease [Deltaproteobacteria bacterium]|nr:ABC transporter permease [Deltaproteobacteria bacterium]